MNKCPHCQRPAKTNRVTCGEPACIAKAFIARNEGNRRRALAAIAERRAAKVAAIPERRCPLCIRVLVIRDDECPSAFARRQTCCTTSCRPIELAPLPDWVDFGRYDVRTVACGAMPAAPMRRTLGGVAG